MMCLVGCVGFGVSDKSILFGRDNVERSQEILERLT